MFKPSKKSKSVLKTDGKPVKLTAKVQQSLANRLYYRIVSGSKSKGNLTYSIQYLKRVPI